MKRELFLRGLLKSGGRGVGLVRPDFIRRQLLPGEIDDAEGQCEECDGDG